MSPTKPKNRSPQEKEYLRVLGEHIRYWREKKNLTQEQFSIMSGFGRSYITEIETGKRNISFLNFSKITQVLDIEGDAIKMLFEELKLTYKK